MEINSIKPDELSSILKGIRYLYGYTQKDLAKKLNVGSGSVSRWEMKYSKLERKNQNINNLLNKIPYSKEELIKYGNINIKELIEEVKKKYNLSYRKCAELFDVWDSVIKLIKDEKTGLNVYSINKIIDRYKKIKNIKDKRMLLFSLYEKRFVSNKKGLYIRYIRQKLGITQIELAKKANITSNQIWKFEGGHYKIKTKFYEKLRNALRDMSNKFCILEKEVLKEIKNKSNPELLQINQAKKYPFIIGFKSLESCGSEFEEYVYKFFKNLGFEVFRNPIVADRYLKIQHSVDIFAVKDKNKIFIECKNINHNQIRNKFKEYGDGFLELKKICPKIIIVSNSLISKKKKLKENRRGITVLDSNDLEKIKKNHSLLFKYLKQKRLTLPDKFDSLENIKSFMSYCNLSCRQIALLIGISPIYMQEILYKKKNLNIKIKLKLKKILNLAKKMDVRDLHFKANFRLTLSKYCTNVNNSLELWKRGAKYNKIINFVSGNHKGSFLEKNVSNILRSMGWEVFQNVILANKSVSEKHEIDIYALNGSNEMIIETKDQLGGYKKRYAHVIRELEHKANLLEINKKIIITRSNIKSLYPFSRKNIEILRYDKNLKENLQKMLFEIT